MVVIDILDLYEIDSTNLLHVVAWIIHLDKGVSLNISGLEHWDIREEKKEEKELAMKEARIPNLYKLTVVVRVFGKHLSAWVLIRLRGIKYLKLMEMMQF